MNKPVILTSLLAVLTLAPTSVLSSTSEVEAHLDCAAVFIQMAQLTSGDASAMWGDYAVQVMGMASDMSSVEAVQSDLRERVPARKQAFADDVANQGQQVAEQNLMQTLTGCGQRYGLLQQ